MRRGNGRSQVYAGDRKDDREKKKKKNIMEVTQSTVEMDRRWAGERY